MICFFQLFYKKYGIENPFKSFGKNSTLFDNPEIQKENGIKCDLLLINSKPLSNQYALNKKEMTSFIEKMAEKYKVITTTKSLPNIECTLDYKFNLLNIANIAIKSKYVVGIATAPIIPCFNIWSIDQVKNG